jgi:tetratricopeptide (TPR) repeat protein
MAFDKRKALQTALVYTQQGRWDKAINEYQAILKSDPADLSVYNMLGDLYARIGNKEGAISYYLKLGELYRADGLSVKAIAVYKKIIKLDSSNIPAYLACGDLYAEQGLVAEARIQYITAADAYGKQGSARNALNVYRKLADLDPTNLTIRAKCAEMLLKEGLPKEAADEFVKVASGCVQIGQLPEAERFYKRVLQITQDSLEAHLGLGHLYFRSNDIANAINHLGPIYEAGRADVDSMLTLAEAYQKNCQLEGAEEVLLRLVESNPENSHAKILLGRVRLKMGKIEEGYLIFNEIVQSHLEQGEAGAGVELLKEVKNADPGFVKVRKRLVDLYRQIGDETQAQEESKQIADILYQQKDWIEARSAFLEVLQTEPNDEEVRGKLAALEEHLKGPEPEPIVLADVSVAPEPEALSRQEPFVVSLEAEPEEQMPSVELHAEDTLPKETSPQDLVPPPAEVSREGKDIEASLAKEAQEHQVEAEIYLKYGIYDKAVDHLNRVLEISPQDIEAHQQLKEIYLHRGDQEAVVKECLILAQFLEEEGRISEATSEIEEILRIDPEHADAKRRMQAMHAASVAEEVLASSLEQIPISGEMVDEPLSLETPLEIMSSLEDMSPGDEKASSVVQEPPIQEEVLPQEFAGLLEGPEGEQEGEEASSSAVIMETRSPAGIEEDLAEADFYLQHEMLEEAKLVYHRILKADPLNEFAQQRLMELEPGMVAKQEVQRPEKAPVGKPFEEEAMLTVPESGPERVLGKDPEALGAGAPPVGIQPLPGEASLEEIPSIPPVSSKISLIKEVTPVFKVAPPAAVPSDEGFVDFAAELEKELERDAQQKTLEELARSEITPPTLDEILQEFQKGVRQTVEEKDFDTHYNLGIAYKDMDLLEEAIEEFRLAAKDPSLALDCSQLIGLCYKKMGAVNLGIEEFLKGLSIPDQRPERYRGLKYELALGYEASGNFKGALDLFSAIFQEDPDFRDVAAKVKLLSAPKIQSYAKAEAAAAGEQQPVAEKKPPMRQKRTGEKKPAVEEEPESPEPKAPGDVKSPPSPKPSKRKVHYI